MLTGLGIAWERYVRGLQKILSTSNRWVQGKGKEPEVMERRSKESQGVEEEAEKTTVGTSSTATSVVVLRADRA